MKLEIAMTWRPDNARPSPLVESQEDEATMGKLQILVGGANFTQAVRLDGAAQDGPHVPGAPLAEWLLWHWWRLLWEPQSKASKASVEWIRAHDIACIGGGWLWPRIAVASDGHRVALHTRPSTASEMEPLGYTMDAKSVVSREGFEQGVDVFVNSVLERLGRADGSRLTQMRDELAAERNSEGDALHRKVEALLGHAPDGGDPDRIKQVIESGNALGLNAMLEAAADSPLSSDDIFRIAKRHGIPVNLDDGASPSSELLWDGDGKRAPWRLGVAAADGLRKRERLGDGPIGNERLEQLLGMSRHGVQGRRRHRGGWAFALRETESGRGRVLVLNSGRRTTRRFKAARLLGDRMLVETNDRLRPITQAHTYRQKMQRAFAAEFLCPFPSLKDQLAGDYSGKSMGKAAKRFDVSLLLVHAQLADHRLMPSLEADNVELAA